VGEERGRKWAAPPNPGRGHGEQRRRKREEEKRKRMWRLRRVWNRYNQAFPFVTVIQLVIDMLENKLWVQ